MTPRLLLPLITLVFAAFAGCIDDASDPDEPESGTQDQDGAAAAAEGGTDATEDDKPNVAPLLSLNVAPGEGQAPLEVRFDIAGSDPNGDTVSWALDADGDGTDDLEGEALPAAFNFTFQESGTYVARLVGTDGEHEVEKTREVLVRPAPTAEPPPPWTESGEATGVWAPGAGHQGEPTTHVFPLDVLVNNFTATITWEMPTIDLDWQIFAPDGTSAGRRATYNEPTGTAYSATEAPIVVTDPDLLAQLGDWTIVVEGAIAVQAEYTITVTFQ